MLWYPKRQFWVPPRVEPIRASVMGMMLSPATVAPSHILLDTFTGSSGVLTGHTGEVGATWTDKTANTFSLTGSGTCKNDSNSLTITTASGTPTASSAYDVTLILNLLTREANQNMGVVCRYVDANNYILTRVQPNSNSVLFANFSGGSFVEFQQPAVTLNVGTITAVVHISNASKTLSINGTQVATLSTNPVTGSEVIGLFSGNTPTDAQFVFDKIQADY